jgi:hypothetical protein
VGADAGGRPAQPRLDHLAADDDRADGDRDRPNRGRDEREAERRLVEQQSIDRRLPYVTVPAGVEAVVPSAYRLATGALAATKLTVHSIAARRLGAGVMAAVPSVGGRCVAVSLWPRRATGSK